MLSIKDQAERISRCRFTFDLKGNKFNGIGRMNIFDKAIFAAAHSGCEVRMSATAVGSFKPLGTPSSSCSTVSRKLFSVLLTGSAKFPRTIATR
jgi:hypothetical protein